MHKSILLSIPLFDDMPYESLVSASSQSGIDSDVFISAPDADLSGDLIVLSPDFLKTDTLLKTPCAQIDNESLGSSVVAQREGVPIMRRQICSS